MNAHRVIVGMCVAFTLSTSAFAAADVGAKQNSVQKLYGVCKSSNPNIMFRCAAYVQGFSTMMHIVGEASARADVAPDKRDALKSYGICYRGMVTVADMMQGFLNWTERHPQDWDKDGEYGLLASLKEAWPCN